MLKHIFFLKQIQTNFEKYLIWYMISCISFFPFCNIFCPLQILFAKEEGCPEYDCMQCTSNCNILLSQDDLRVYYTLGHLASIFNTPYLHPCGHPCKYYSLGWFFILLYSRKVASFARAVYICAFDICICVIHNVCACVFVLIFHFSLLS